MIMLKLKQRKIIYIYTLYMKLIFLLYYSKVVIGNMETALYKISVLINPLSETAQKWSTILEVNNIKEN